MQAWRKIESGGSLILQDVPEPEAGPGEVVVDVVNVGLCHSDVGIVEGPGEAWVSQIPITLGHEVAGTISSLGEGVTDFAVGDKVSILCLDFDNCPGISRDGGYAAQTIGRADSLVRIPDGISFAQAAVGTDAGMTSHHAVKVAAGVTEGTRLGIIGLGGLGALGARIGVLLGADVYAAEPRKEAREAAADLGIIEVFDDVSGFVGLNLDVIIDFAGFGTTTAQAIEAVRRRGRVVQVGLGKLESTISTNTIVTNEITLVGSVGGVRDDVEAVYTLMAEKGLESTVEMITFDQIGVGIERLQAGDVRGRLVAALSE